MNQPCRIGTLACLPGVGWQQLPQIPTLVEMPHGLLDSSKPVGREPGCKLTELGATSPLRCRCYSSVLPRASANERNRNYALDMNC